MRVTLTEKGRTKLDQIDRSHWKDVEEQVNPLDVFTEHEVEELERLLAKLNRRLQQITQSTKGASYDPTE